MHLNVVKINVVISMVIVSYIKLTHLEYDGWD